MCRRVHGHAVIVSLSLLAFCLTEISQASARRAPYWGGLLPKEAPRPGGAWYLENAFPHLDFVDPVWLTETPQRDGKLFVVSKGGLIYEVDTRKSPAPLRVILDLSKQVQISEDAGMMLTHFGSSTMDKMGRQLRS